MTRKWTVMVYFAGENRLFDEMVYSMKDIKRVATDSDRDVALLAQYSAKWVKKSDVSATVLPTPRRFNFITKSPKYPAGSVAMNLQTNLTTPRYPPPFVDELAQFIAWGIRRWPARHYMVVFSGDGGGVLADFLPSFGRPGKSLKARELTQVFRKVRKILKTNVTIDVVGLDSCLMSMTEIAFGIRGYAKYLVGSQGNEDDMGWPFADILYGLKRMTDPRRVAATTVDRYNTYYLDYALIAGASANLSAVDLTKMDGLAAAVSKFTKAALRLMPEDGDLNWKQHIFVQLLVNAHWTSQNYRQDQYTDLYDFCDVFQREATAMVKKHSSLQGSLQRVIDACDEIKSVLCDTDQCSGGNKVVINSCSVGVKYQYSHGLSIYFPWGRVEEEYFPGLTTSPGSQGKADFFARKTLWGKFLTRYVERSQRVPREGYANKQLPFAMEVLKKDPPEGRGFLGAEYDGAKNPPATWKINGCVIKPVLNS